MAEQGQLGGRRNATDVLDLDVLHDRQPLSWATEFVKIGLAEGAVNRVQQMEKMVQEVQQHEHPASGITAALLRAKAQNLREVLPKQLSNRELLTTGLKDTASVGLGEAFSAVGPFYMAPPPLAPADIDPDLFRGQLNAQVDALDASAQFFLSDLADRIDDLEGEAWDHYDDSEFQSQLQGMARARPSEGASQLDAAKLTDGAEWPRSLKGLSGPRGSATRLHRVVRRLAPDPGHTGMSFTYEDNEYDRVRKLH